MKRWLALAALALLGPGALVASAKAAPAAHSPALEKALGYFAGKWTCTGGHLKQPPMTATVTWSFSPDGSLFEQHINVPESPANEGYHARNIASYDATNKRVVTVANDEYGAWTVQSTSEIGRAHV